MSMTTTYYGTPAPGAPRLPAPPGWDPNGAYQGARPIAAMTPDQIAEMQYALKNLGFYSGEITGTADLNTLGSAGAFMTGFGYGDANALGYVWHPDMWYSLLTANHYVANNLPAPPEIVQVLQDNQTFWNNPNIRVPAAQPTPASPAPGEPPPPPRADTGLPGATPDDNTGVGMTPQEAAETSAYAYINSFLTRYGLGEGSAYDLTGWVIEQMQSGLPEDTIIQLMEETDQWRNRFAGNETIRQRALANGDPIANVLSPEEYLAFEHSVEDLGRRYGLPPQLWTDQEFINGLIGGGVSPDEFEDRTIDAFYAVQTMGPEVLDVMYELLGADGLDQLAAALLDPDRLWPEIERMVETAVITGTGVQQGFGIDPTTGGRIADLGYTRGQATQVFQQLSDMRALTSETASETGTDLTEGTLVNAGFNLDGGSAAEQLRRRRQGREAQLGGGGGALTGVTEGVVGVRTAR
jgi:hypothetical protein